MEDASAAEAAGLLESLDAFFRIRHQAEQEAARIAGIDARAQQFAAACRELATAIAPELIELEPAEIAKQLQVRLAAAHQQAARKANLQKQQAKEQQRLQTITDQIRHHQSDLRQLCKEAACEAPEELAEAAERSRQRREAEKELAQAELHLVGLAQGMPLAEFIAEAAAEEPDALPAQLELLHSTSQRLSSQRDDLLRQINTLEKEIRTATGGDSAVTAEETAKAELANLAVLAEDYTRLKLAEAVLQCAMQRYRQQNQGPILERASEYFSLLTLGSFSRLQPHWNEEGHAVLVGVRADGETEVTIEGMSSGSMDQLYLALRLASLEHHLKQREPLPLVVDDILIHFDDARSAAALRALAEVSQHTQVIMFTHHAHLVELARKTLPAETLFVQELPSPVG